MTQIERTSRFEPSPNINCSICDGQGFLVSPHGETSRATMCTCVPKCTRCNGDGLMHVVENGHVMYGRCRCRKLFDRIEMFNRADIPARHSTKRLDHFYLIDTSLSTAVTHFQIWLDNFGSKKETKGMVLHGAVGRGKTHFMVGLCRELIFEYGLAVRFVEFSRLLAQLRTAFSAGSSGESILDDLVNVPILAIDELGKGRVSDWELSVIDEIISRRYNAMKPILGTTNYEWKTCSSTPTPAMVSAEFSQTLGDRIGMRAFSRLQEVTIPILLKGADYRTLQPKDIDALHFKNTGTHIQKW